MVKKISELRNERLDITKRIFKLDEIIYHCITRQAGKVIVYETPASPIDVENIKISDPDKTKSIIYFSDSHSEYSFNLSKSTLYKRFLTENTIMEIPIRILQDPFSEIEKIIAEAGLIFAPIKPQPHVFLPLYSNQGGKHVPEKSGLNQWNAGGRARKVDEVYIPIPAWVHKKFPNFFPDRDNVFELTLPDRTVLDAGVCQAGRKALMSNPNTVLGKWILRDVLNLKERELMTYEKLQAIGLDSVVVYKIDNEHYDIDFAKIDSYQNFFAENSDKGDIEDPEEIIEE